MGEEVNWRKEEDRGLLRRGKVSFRRSPTPHLLRGVAGACGPGLHLLGMATLPSGRSISANTHKPRQHDRQPRSVGWQRRQRPPLSPAPLTLAFSFSSLKSLMACRCQNQQSKSSTCFEPPVAQLPRIEAMRLLRAFEVFLDAPPSASVPEHTGHHTARLVSILSRGRPLPRSLHCGALPHLPSGVFCSLSS